MSDSESILVTIPAGTKLEYERTAELDGGQDKLLTKQDIEICVDPGTIVKIGGNHFRLAKDVPDVTLKRDYVLPAGTDVMLSIGFVYALSEDVPVRFPAEMKVKLSVDTVLLQADSSEAVTEMTLKKSCDAVIMTSDCKNKIPASCNKIFVAKANCIDVLDADSLVLLTTLSCANPIICTSVDGSVLLVADSRTTNVWDTITLNKIREITCPNINSISISPCCQYFVVINSGGVCQLYSILGQFVRCIGLNISAACFTADGKYIVTADVHNIYVMTCDSNCTLVKTNSNKEMIVAMCSFPDGQHICVADRHNVFKYEVLTGKMCDISPHNKSNKNFGISVACAADKYAYAVYWCTTGNYIEVVDGEMTKLIGPNANTSYSEFSHRKFVRDIAFSPDGKHIVSGGDDHKVMIWDAVNKTYCKSYDAGAEVKGVCWR